MGFSAIPTSMLAVTLMLLIVVSAFTLTLGVYRLLRQGGEYVEAGAVKVEVEVRLTVDGVSERQINVTVRNRGSRTVFLNHEGRLRSVFILGYESTVGWVTCLIEDYELLSVRISGFNRSFNPAVHRHLNPGEEAVIRITLPDDMPGISVEGVAAVVFVTHHGVTAVGEGVRVEGS